VRHPLDEKFPEWGEGPYYTVMLKGVVRLQDLLNHLYVLVPVLDAEKHYWIGQDEVEKLLRKGEGWLAAHPHKEAIVKRYLPRQRQLAREALAQRNYQSAVLAGCINLGKLLHCARFRPHTNHKPPATTSRTITAYTLPSGPVVPPLHIGAPTG